jgi:hypothetical protein
MSQFLKEHEATGDPNKPARGAEYMRLFVGVDLGYAQDYSAAVCLEQLWTPAGISHYRVASVVRWNLRTDYSQVAVELRRVEEQLKTYAASKGKLCYPVFIIDCTGVGEGVFILVKREMPNADLWKCYLTGGTEPRVDYSERTVYLPKNQGVSTLNALFDSDCIHFTTKLALIEAIKGELRAFRAKISSEGRESFNAKAGAHDDILVATLLGAWIGENEYHDDPNKPSIW